ncbi:MAG: bifunctional isocitrate dehydrogenase kinase/phosphatase [Gammaproteobacteria bacterium]|nr:bifunctional isocitrate dehydrogenase kinase/phosphatase [Gammaproteobacteria bacterium]
MTNTNQQLVKLIHKQFTDYYHAFENVADRAPLLFKKGEMGQRLSDDLSRIKLYRAAIDESVSASESILGPDTYRTKVWKRARKHCKKIYDDELATTYFTSVMRKIFARQGLPVEFKDDGIKEKSVNPDKNVLLYPFDDPVQLGKAILLALTHSVFSDSLSSTVRKNIDCIVNIILEQSNQLSGAKSLELLEPVFYRGKGAYLVGQIRAAHKLIPIVFCIVHTTEGIAIDAVLVGQDATRNFLFSSTRSAFTVSTHSYRELYSFVHRLFPRENPAYVFDLIGFTHPSKISLLKQLRKALKRGAVLEHIGNGPADLVFGFKRFPLVFKVLRGSLPDRKSILRNHEKIHQTDRLGQVLDLLDYRYLTFKVKNISSRLLKCLVAEQSEDLTIDPKHIVCKRLYASRRIQPVGEYIQRTDSKKAQRTLMDVGWNIKHLAAMGYIPRSMGLEHFGITQWGRVVYLNHASLSDIRLYLFRYQSDTTLGIERYSANPNRFEKDMDIPSEHRELFRAVHGDLFLPDFWEERKIKFYDGHFPDVYPYPSRFRLKPRRFRNTFVKELKRLDHTGVDKQIRVLVEDLAVIDVELAGLSFLRLEVPNPRARVLVIEPIGPEIIAQLHRRLADVTFDILESESEIVENSGHWMPGIHGKLKTLVQVRSYDYVIGYVNETFDHDFFKFAQLKGFLLLSTGTHNIDIDAATKFYTVVTNAPGPTTTTVAEQNLGLLLDAIFSKYICYGRPAGNLARLTDSLTEAISPLISAQVMWLCLLQRALKLDDMYAFGSSQRYVRTGVSRQATVYHDQIGQNKEAEISRSIGVIGLNQTGLHLIQFAIAFEATTIYVIEREYWDLTGEDRERMNQMVSLVQEISQTPRLTIQILPVNRSALLKYASFTFNTQQTIFDINNQESRRTTRHIDMQQVFIRNPNKLAQLLAEPLTLGIQGFGRIGEAVALRAIAMGTNVIVYQRDPQRVKYLSKLSKLNRLIAFLSEWQGFTKPCEFVADKLELFRRSNLITTLATTTDSTLNWVTHDGLQVFAAQAKSPIRVIVSAGKGLVDENALLSFLKKNPDAEARLDVLLGEHQGNAYLKLIDQDGFPLQNLKVTGHTAAAVHEVRRLKIYKALDNLRQLLDGRIPPNIVNFSRTKENNLRSQSIIQIEGLSFIRLQPVNSKARVLIIEPLTPDIVLQLQHRFSDVSFDILLAESELVKDSGKWIPGINTRLDTIVSKQKYDYCLGYCNASFNASFFAQANLKALILFASAIHHIDLEAATQMSTLVTNVPGFTTTAVTEQNIGMLLEALYGQYVHESNSLGETALQRIKIKGKHDARSVAQILWFSLLKRTLKLDSMYQFGAGDKYVRTGIRQDATVYHDQLGQYHEATIRNSIAIIGLDEVGLNLIELAMTHEISVIYLLKEEYDGLKQKHKKRLHKLSKLLKIVSQTKDFSVEIKPVHSEHLTRNADYTIKTPSAYHNKTLKQVFPRSGVEILAESIFISDKRVLSRSLEGLTFGVQGLGRIGEAVVQRALTLGADIKVCQRQPDRPRYQEKRQRLQKLAMNRAKQYRQSMNLEYVDKEELFRSSNVVSTLAATTVSTRHWVDSSALRMLGTHAKNNIRVLINAGKGLLNESELIPFLQQHPDIEVRLDVLSNEQNGISGHRFLDLNGKPLKNLKIAGHTAAAIPELRRLKILHAINNLWLLLDGKIPNNILNEDALTPQL